MGIEFGEVLRNVEFEMLLQPNEIAKGIQSTRIWTHFVIILKISNALTMIGRLLEVTPVYKKQRKQISSPR